MKQPAIGDGTGNAQPQDAIVTASSPAQSTKKKLNNQQETPSCKFVQMKLNKRIMESQLHSAALNQNVEDLVQFLSEGMNPNIYSYTKADINHKIETPLQSWVEGRHQKPNEEILTTLLNYGADLEAKNYSGLTPLQYCLPWGGNRFTIPFVPLLLNHGARINHTGLKDLLVLIDTSEQEINLNLSQLDIIDESYFPIKVRDGAQVCSAYQAIVDIKRVRPNDSIDVRAIYDSVAQSEQDQSQATSKDIDSTETLSDEQQLDNAKQPSEQSVVKPTVEQRQNHEQPAAQTSTEQKQARDDTQFTQQIIDEKNRDIKKVEADLDELAQIFTSANQSQTTKKVDITDLQVVFKASKYYKETFEPQLMAKLRAKHQSSKFPFSTREALLNGINDINKKVDDVLTQAKQDKKTVKDIDSITKSINTAVVDFIENNLVKRDPIKKQPPLVKWLKRIAGVLAAIFTLGALLYRKADREIFTALFFSSRAARNLTEIKQVLQRPSSLRS